MREKLAKKHTEVLVRKKRSIAVYHYIIDYIIFFCIKCCIIFGYYAISYVYMYIHYTVYCLYCIMFTSHLRYSIIKYQIPSNTIHKRIILGSQAWRLRHSDTLKQLVNGSSSA